VIPRRSFVSDNSAGVHPRVLAAIERANRGHVLGYGGDPWTERATARLRELFGAAEALFVFGGTAANVLSLRPFVDSTQSVICAASSHLWRDECGAPERFLGSKLIPVETGDGKLTPETIRPALRDRGVVHRAQPRAVSVSQPTEWGPLYQLEELRALAELTRENGMILHVDGARLANAAAALELPLPAFGAEAGVDVLSFGGTKNGLLAGEAILYFDSSVAAAATLHRKQAAQLASKMRFLAVQFDALLTDDLWRELASHANGMADRLARGLGGIEGVEIVQPRQSNAVFARLPRAAIAPLRDRADFHLWDPERRIHRLMTAWDTRPEDVDGFVATAALSAS